MEPRDRQIRVALIITELEPGGAERMLTELAKGLDRRRFAVRVYVLSGPPPVARAVLSRELQAAGVAVEFFGARKLWHFPGVVRRLTHALRAWQPDVVQGFLFHANVVAAVACRRAGIEHVVWGIRVAERGRRWHFWLLQRLADRAERIVCVSRGVAEFMHSRGFPPKSIEVIPNGVDLATIDQAAPIELASLGVRPRRKALVFVGRFDRQKGTDWLLQVCPRLFEVLPMHDLLMVGSGPQEKQLRRLASQSSAAGRVHFLGWRGDVPSILKACDLLLVPSRWEGMPNVVLEAMVCGIPVLATPVEGIEELLGEGMPFQTSELKSEVFCQTALRLASDGVLRGRLGNENCARVEQHFTLAAMVQSYERLYQRLVEPPK